MTGRVKIIFGVPLGILVPIFLASVALHYRERNPKMIEVFEHAMVLSATFIALLLIGLCKKAKEQNSDSN
jgi:hypothetical protein